MKKKLTQSQIKERQEKTKKIKSLLLRSLNIVCYCLSVLFIIMAIAIGAQSCSNKNKSETESAAISPSSRIQYRLDNDSVDITDFEYLYICKYSTTQQSVTLDYETAQLPLIESFGDVPTPISSTTTPSSLYRSFTVSDVYYVDNETSCYLISHFIVSFYYVHLSGNQWAAYLGNCWIESNSLSGWQPVFSCYYNVSPYTSFNFHADVKLLATSTLIDNYFINYFFDEQEINPLSFSFNNQINYNATYNASISQPFVAIGSTAQSTQTMIDIGWFYSGGKLWDGIKVYWMNAYASTFMMESGELYSVGSNVDIYSYFMMMEYRNSVTGEGVMVNSRDMVPYDNNGGLSYYVERTSNWVSSNYQTITLLTDTSETNITNLNKYNNTTAGGSITTGGNIGLQNGFTLLGSAFTSILPFLAIQVLPGLSIGLLLFIPLIVIIIILVFKVVKK